ncbi:MAG: hypothetical protein COB04_03120 [Gammaproteobacteria bacterium]|nr:MAG: hypothetical protein COB04_03120 [Gammaproteobacteria bacterium]
MLFAVLIQCAFFTNAGSRDQAKRIHDRIAGVQASDAVIDSMAAAIDGENPGAAAFTAMDNAAFYNVTLKNMVTPWTNEEQTAFAPLNDYTATVIGIVRDDLDFRLILSGDLLYIGSSGPGIPAYNNSNNEHYAALEAQNVSLKDNLVGSSPQSSITGLPAEATAGVLTSRAAAQAFFKDGTNRAMFRFTLLNHLCTDLEGVRDTSRPADRIRQDVSRSPGGNSSIFLNSCIGCHTGMDPMAQSFAYYQYEYDEENDTDGVFGRLAYNREGDVDPETGSRVQAKYHINSNSFKYGYITPNDRWDNYWREGQNQSLGWDEGLPGGGSGAKSMGQELAHSDAFSQCQVRKVFRTVCLREPLSAQDNTQLGLMTTAFKTSNYKLKQVFADSAVYCMGE